MATIRQCKKCGNGGRTVLALAIVSLLLAVAGCQNSPFAPNTAPPGSWQNAGPTAQPPAQASQFTQLQQRNQELDADNRDLHAQLAQSRQREALLREQTELTRQRLQDAAGQLEQLQLARQESERRLAAIQASAPRRVDATITANNSLRTSLARVEISGIEIREDGDVLRLELPADELFNAGAQLKPAASGLLDQVADAIARHYPRNRVGIEGHAEATPAGRVSAHQLSNLEAMAVFGHLTTRNRLPARQLFIVAHGANHPRVSNATLAGRGKNRRVEVVIYPEEY